jgi:phosphoserine aminotransferase
MTSAYNFNAGPAGLPESVLQQAKAELLDWQNLGASLMEISHRSSEFMAMARETEQDLRELLNIPDNYKILFLQGGGRSQFSMVPLNLLRGKTTADYLDTGMWSNMALKEAMRYTHVNIVASSADQQYRTIPKPSTWQKNPDAAYFHYVDNETVNGNECPTPPNITDVPLVCDMSSNLLSRVIDIKKFGLIYAAAQKNIGISGVTIVIVREDLLGDALPITPMMFNYTLHANAHSLLNTSPTFAWYITGLVLKWLKEQGGVQSIEKINAQKAKKLYGYLDNSSLYENHIEPTYRSRMNVVFKLKDENLNASFLVEAKAAGLIGLKGHQFIGGMRASLYNAVSAQAVDALIAFMREFERKA